LDWVRADDFQTLKGRLGPWYRPYEQKLKTLDLEKVLNAIKHDKKNTGNAVNCILTRGPGRMEKTAINLDQQLRPWMTEFISSQV
jgi:3-dehydroquinate synthase